MANAPYNREDEDEDTKDYGFGGADTLMRLPGPNPEPDPGVAAAAAIPTDAGGTAGFPEDDPYQFGSAPKLPENLVNTGTTPTGPTDVLPTEPSIQPENLVNTGTTPTGPTDIVPADMGPNVYSEQEPGATDSFVDAPTVDAGIEQYTDPLANAQTAMPEVTRYLQPDGTYSENAPTQAQTPATDVLAPDAAPGTGEGTTSPQPAGGTTQPGGFPAGGGDSAQPYGGGSVGSALNQAVLEALKNPSRYDSEVVKNAANVIQAQLGEMREAGYRGLGEHFAGRGLLGSSLESTGMGEFEEDVQRIGSERFSALEREQAMTYGQDRASAMNAGLGVESQALQKKAMEQDAGFKQQMIDLQREGMGQDQAYKMASLQWQREYGMAGLGMDQQRLDMSKTQMEQDAGFRQQSLDLQAQGMSADDAYRQASLDWQKQYGTAGLEMDKSRMESDNSFRQRSQDLQEQGMNADEAYRQAQSEWQRDFSEQGFGFEKERWGDQQSMGNLQMILQALDAFGPDVLKWMNTGG